MTLSRSARSRSAVAYWLRVCCSSGSSDVDRRRQMASASAARNTHGLGCLAGMSTSVPVTRHQWRSIYSWTGSVLASAYSRCGTARPILYSRDFRQATTAKGVLFLARLQLSRQPSFVDNNRDTVLLMEKIKTCNFVSVIKYKGRIYN